MQQSQNQSNRQMNKPDLYISLTLKCLARTRAFHTSSSQEAVCLFNFNPRRHRIEHHPRVTLRREAAQVRHFPGTQLTSPEAVRLLTRVSSRRCSSSRGECICCSSLLGWTTCPTAAKSRLTPVQWRRSTKSGG